MKALFATSLAAALLLIPAAHATTTSLNFGSLGAAANGTNSDGVVLGTPGPLTAPGDTAAGYDNTNTVVPFNAALNPSSSSPFTIEFWANPTFTDNDDAVVSNRTHSGNRSGWVFFQRAAGWNFRMYNGSGGTVGLEITGGTSVIGSWTHVVAVWDGTAPQLYVNGVDTLGSVTGPGGYNVNTSPTNFALGAHDNLSSPYRGFVDETAIYGRALAPAEILEHFNAASSATPDFYRDVVMSDLPLLYLTNNPVPEPGIAGLLLLGLTGGLRRRR